ncbi:uncharacterized protein N7498_002734 [Penicillium cinerascens]|uniref:Uncharacterized protein n=1 Tax=Penicillium cinerascens TaxID=70096 RepID=A0A9W9NAN4_9EURO|nr:uncharacterized protein N7498_002734 [Penicillium cinerascens]KAJ5216327.1 hypothetical protein N7498_002734 [Penicillium cinerascens]
MTRFLIATTALLAIVVSSMSTQLSNSLQTREDIEPGSPLYNCHEACESISPGEADQVLPRLGEVILISETDNYCNNSTFTSDLKSCLKCAETYDIWKYYGTKVKLAASGCNDDATPSPSSATSEAAVTATTGVNNTSTSNTSNATVSTTSTAYTTGTTPGTAATATNTTTTNGAVSFVQQNAALPAIMGLLAWALTA